MHNHFQPIRFYRFLRFILAVNRLRLVYFIIAAIGMALIATLIPVVGGMIKSTLIFNSHEAQFIFILFVTGFLFSSGGFVKNRSKIGLMEYLSIPASQFEKFLGELVLSVVLYPLCLFVTYYLFSLGINAFLSELVNAFFMPFNLELPYYGEILLVYLFAQGLFLFSSITYQKMPLLKVLLWCILPIIVVFVFISIGSLSSNSIMGFDEETYRNVLNTFILRHRYEMAIPLGLFFYALTYLKLKEKEA